MREPEYKVGMDAAVCIDGKRLSSERYVYIMMNKPPGVLCATEDRTGQTVLDLLPTDMRRPGLFPAGRLDKDTEGFVLITNDGPFAHRILSPGRHVPKTYLARLNGSADPDFVREEFARGVSLGEGETTSPARLSFSDGADGPLARVTIFEGMYHQVKRMFAKYGLRVTWLRRVRIGGLSLDDSLAPGACRLLSAHEVSLLEQDAAP